MNLKLLTSVVDQCEITKYLHKLYSNKQNEFIIVDLSVTPVQRDERSEAQRC